MVVAHDFQEVLDASTKTAALNLPHHKESSLNVVFESSTENTTQFHGSNLPLPFAASEVFHTSIIAWRRLTTVDKDCKAVYEVSFDLKGSNFSFKPGDTIGIIPENNKDEVDFLIKHLSFTPVADLKYTLTIDSEKKFCETKIPAHIPIVSTVRHVLTHVVDLRAIVKKLFLLALSKHSKEETERKVLEYLCSKEGSAAYTTHILNTSIGLLDLLANFKSCKPPIEVLFQHLPRLLPRPYSIATSPLKETEVIKICFSVMNIGNNRKGLTTGWMEDIILKQEQSLEDSFRKLSVQDSGLIPIYLRKNINCFGLPEKFDCPLILIGAGTGVAPYIGFLEEIECLKQDGVQNIPPCIWLFFGCRHPKMDFIYQKELNNFVNKNVLSCLKTSFSRFEDHETKYVQNAIIENGEDIVKLIKNGSKIFVCGDVKTMASQVKDAVVNSLVKYDDRSPEEAEKFVCDMQKNKSYIVDIWN